MRAWGLAEGLKRNGIEVTVGVNNSFPQELKEHEGIRLVNWGQDERFADLINSYDAVLVSYTMGSDSVFIAENINDAVQLILDAYVPIYVEVSARESKDIDTEYRNYMADIMRFSKVLRRGDYFLCASEVQKTFYIGVLSSLGIINPRSYRQDRIIIAPFGIHDLPAKAETNPYRELGIAEKDFVALWFGGLYPWFRIQELLDAVLELSKDPHFKFVVVGGRNPFNPNPDFSMQYDKAYSFAVEHKLLNKSVFFVDWVDFNKRINWFKHAAVVISLNQPGQEKGFSWRTRVMDFVWGELAILTNGGDPLSEDLIAAKAALRLNELSATELAHNIQSLQHNPRSLTAIRKNILALKPTYYWQNIMAPVAELIKRGEAPFHDELEYRKRLHIDEPADILAEPSSPLAGRLHKARRAASLPRKAVLYARRKGVKRSARLAASIAKNQAKGRLRKRERQYIFIGHHMDNTGAPVVLMQLIEEYAEKYGGRNVRLVTSHVAPNHLRRLREMGVKVDKAVLAFGWRLIRLQLDIKRNDFVLINTIATYENYRDFIFHELEVGLLKHAYWFIHEDKAQINAINPDFMRKHNLTRIRKLLASKRLTVITPSARTEQDYNKIFGSNEVTPMPLLVHVPDKYKKTRPARDYKTLRFYLAGHAGDGRKGQMIAIAAFNDFLTRYYQKNPQQYRDFSLVLVSIGDDYLSQQIKWVGGSLLEKHLQFHPQVPREEALALAAQCNTVICCSLNETFGLYVAEGMFMGHVVLRNDSAGMEEQLKEGVNGYFINHRNVHQFANVIEKLLNKKVTSDAQLQAMGKASQDIISQYADQSYLSALDNLKS